MIELQMLSIDAAARELSGTAEAARGFLDVDPVTQNEALLAAELTRKGAHVYRAGEALVGYAPNHGQPRQAFVATTSAQPEALRAMLDILLTYHRSTSYLAMVPAASASVAAFEGCAFTRIGVLREHRFQSGGCQDVLVYFAKATDTCQS